MAMADGAALVSYNNKTARKLKPLSSLFSMQSMPYSLGRSSLSGRRWIHLVSRTLPCCAVMMVVRYASAYCSRNSFVRTVISRQRSTSSRVFKTQGDAVSWGLLRPRCRSMPPTYRSSSSSLMMMDAVDEDEAVDSTKTVESSWNIPTLKKEVTRLVLRSHKKIGKVNTRLSNAQSLVETLTANPDATQEQLEQCPNVDAIAFELEELQERLIRLNELEQELQSIKSKEAVLPLNVAELALSLGVDDKPPQRPARGPKKKKGPRVMEPMRLPYRRYYTEDQTEIRVGKQAEDNDMLSCSPEHRDGSDWWMHASGCAGSHVVIRCSDQNLNEAVVNDAAALAARQSKCNGGVIKVSLTRCRDVKKPPGSKAGLVQLTGSVRSVSVNMKEAQARLNRLDKTVLVN